MGRKKIMVVDDSRTTLMVERTMIEEAGFDTVAARDGFEALEVVVREKPDLVLLDVIMPKMDGFETCRRLRELEEAKAIPIILVTTQGKALKMEIGYRAGCTGYLTKPFNAEQLVAAVRPHLEAKPGEGEPAE
ncbi:two-component response regulator [Labilithrix luteola]|uniref:Two-component response regulator n=1 Tax=Labilithrix luteola TaxID=1391654 RepID=A0A0K1PQP0_9BACT|nr:response regulator [Labilithrix luteola]AKU95434.1 two-component response regulator [Labilithrix luteola]